MAWSTITTYLSNATTVTTTISSSDYADAVAFVQNCIKSGSIMANDNVTIIPVTSVQKFVIS